MAAQQRRLGGFLIQFADAIGNRSSRNAAAIATTRNHHLQARVVLNVHHQLHDLGKSQHPNRQYKPARDARRTVLGTSYATQSSGGGIYYTGIYLGREQQDDAAFPHLGHRLAGARFGLQMPLNAQWGLFATASLESRKYGGADPLFFIVRKDTQLDISAGAAWKIAENWRITPQVNFNRSNSNIIVNDSNKTSLSITARRDF